MVRWRISPCAASLNTLRLRTGVRNGLSDISTRHAVGLHWVSGHAEVRGNEIADEVARGGSVQGFLGPDPALGVSRRDILKGLVVGWSTINGQDGEALVTPKDRLENQSR